MLGSSSKNHDSKISLFLLGNTRYVIWSGSDQKFDITNRSAIVDYLCYAVLAQKIANLEFFALSIRFLDWIVCNFTNRSAVIDCPRNPTFIKK